MRNFRFLITFVLLSISFCYGQEKRDFKIQTIAFYNVENLFDTEDDPLINDEDRTPEGKDKWTEEKYQDKLKNMAAVIAEIGADVAQQPPAIIGLCEIENRKVLEDLVSQEALQAFDYGIVQYNSPDRRGIDVALLYRKEIFHLQNSASHELLIFQNDKADSRIYTRDQLVVSGILDGEEMHFIVNHWPSRSGGEKRSSYRREAAAMLSKKIIDSLQYINPYAKIVTMGDFNDNPSNKSLSNILKAKNSAEDLQLKELYNPMAAMEKKGLGTSAYRDNWSVFDQLIVSQPLTTKDYSSYQFYKAGIFSKDFLITKKGQYKGYPFRSYGYEGYTGGYSDHFPVYIYVIKEVQEQ